MFVILKGTLCFITSNLQRHLGNTEPKRKIPFCSLQAARSEICSRIRKNLYLWCRQSCSEVTPRMKDSVDFSDLKWDREFVSMLFMRLIVQCNWYTFFFSPSWRIFWMMWLIVRKIGHYYSRISKLTHKAWAGRLMVAGWPLMCSISYQRKWKFPPPLQHWWNNSPGGDEERTGSNKEEKICLYTQNYHTRWVWIHAVTAPCPRGSWPSSKPEDWRHWQTADAWPARPSPGSDRGQSWLERRTLQRWRRWPPRHPPRWWGCGEGRGQRLTGSARTRATSAWLLRSTHPTGLTQWSQRAAPWSGSEDGWSPWCHVQPGWHLWAGLHAGWRY